MKLIKVVKSTNSKKKYDALFKDKDGKEKKISFGAAGYGDYTITKDKEQRERYRKRHAKDLLTEKNKKGLGAGALSFGILWGDSTSLKKNISDYKKKYNL
tara:strand:+ start:5006 stop:5305 length:300 start_codon:yes stop_codon:yes gene_type:complete